MTHDGLSCEALDVKAVRQMGCKPLPNKACVQMHRRSMEEACRNARIDAPLSRATVHSAWDQVCVPLVYHLLILPSHGLAVLLVKPMFIVGTPGLTQCLSDSRLLAAFLGMASCVSFLVSTPAAQALDDGVLKIPPPILSRVYQTISRGFVNLLNTCLDYSESGARAHGRKAGQGKLCPAGNVYGI